MRPVLSAAVLIAALAPAAGPVAAEDDAPLGPVFLDKLVADCAAFAADPAKAAEEAPRSVSSMAMVSADGSMVAVTVTAQDGDLYVTSFNSATDLPQGRVVACARSAYFANMGQSPDLEPLFAAIDSRADEILGGKAVTAGGPVYLGGKLLTGKVGRLGYWALDGLPPSASIFVTQTGEAISVSLLKTIAADPDAAPATGGGN